jgi:hypothetical protein
MTDEKPSPTRTDQAWQIAEEYASDQREIIRKLSRFSPTPQCAVQY